MALDPDIRRILDKIAVAREAIADDGDLIAQRALHDQTAIDILGLDIITGVEHRDLVIPGTGGPIHATLTKPTNSTGTTLVVYLHGGSWVFGSAKLYTPLTDRLAKQLDATVLSVDYRLAPEHPFPAGWEDSRDALRWASEHAEELGAADSIILSGDSAGGNFTASLSVLARDEGIRLAAQLMFYPSSDLTKRYPAMDTYATGYLLETPPVEFPDRAYLVDPDLRWDVRASPLFHDSFAGVAPAVIITAEFDPIKEHGTVLAEKMAYDGVRVVQHEAPGMIHGFVQVGNSPAAMHQVDYACQLVTELLTNES